MKVRSLHNMTSAPANASKEQNELAMQAGVVPDGHRRRNKGRTKAVLYRCTLERKQQLERLADRLSVGRPADDRVSFTDTISYALDALEAKLRGQQ
jgi:hypothetical protein